MSYHNANAELYQLPALDAGVQIFDVDHTITRRSTGVRMGQIGLKRKYITRFTLMQFPLHYLRYRAGNYNLGNLPSKLWQFAGVTQEQADSWGQDAFKEYILDDIFSDILKLIRHLKGTGKKLVLCTSSIEFIVKPLADFLEADELVSTRLRFVDGVCTGEIVGGPAFGEGKVGKMRALLDSQGLDMADTAFYSDSINDLPLLLASKWPVPTNPDRLLRKVARQHQWAYLDYRNQRR